MSEYSDKNYASYDARADTESAKNIAGSDFPFHIEVRFRGGLSSSQLQVFKDAADRWTGLIVGDLPDVLVAGEIIDEVLIEAQGVPIDGVGSASRQADCCGA